MINEKHEERESDENTDHEQFSINQSSSHLSPKNSTASTTGRGGTDSNSKNQSVGDSDVFRGTQNNNRDSISTDSDVTEIRNIVQTIAETVFCRADDNTDQLANHSSNTLGMRVKDSLILKVQQTNRKEIPYDEIKASLACRLIVDDDLQIRFLPRIESLPLSSHSENLSTKQKKSVSLAEEVRVFSQGEDEFFTENEVDFFNELMDTHNQDDRLLDELKSTENDDKMYDLTSKRSSSSPVQSGSFFFDEVHTVESTEPCNQDQKGPISNTMSIDLQKSNSNTSLKDEEQFDGLGENPTISFNADLIISDENERRQRSGFSARDMAVGLRNLSIVSSSLNENKIAVSLVETKADHSSESKMSMNFVSKNETTKKAATIEASNDLNERVTEESKDWFENVQSKLFEHGNEVLDKRSEVVNGDGEESTRHTEEEIEPTLSRKKPSTSKIDIEVEFEEEKSSEPSAEKSQTEGSRMPDNFCKDVERSNAIQVLKAEECLPPKENSRIKRSRENMTNSSKTFEIADKIVSLNSSEEEKRTQRVEKMIEKTTGGEGINENHQHGNLQSTESFENSDHLSLTTIIAFVEMDANDSVPAQPAVESNNGDKIPEKHGALNADFSAAKSQNDENTFTPEAQHNLKRSPESKSIDQKINDVELSEAKEWPESFSRSERVDEAGEADDVNVESFTENGAINEQKLFEKRFIAVQERTNTNKDETSIPECQNINSNESGERTQTNQDEKKLINENNYNVTHLESKSSNKIAVDRTHNQSTENIISPVNYKSPDASSRSEEVDDERIEAIESQEIFTSCEKTSRVFLRIVMSKNSVEEKIAPEELTVDKDRAMEKKHRKSAAINDQHFAGFQRTTLQGSSEIDLEDAAGILLACGESEADKVEKKDSGTLPEIESYQLGKLTLSDENLKKEFALETKTRNSPINLYSPKKTSSKVSVQANKLSKKSSRTDYGSDQQSTNDPSSEVTSSKVSPKASKSSGKLSRTDISELIIPGPNNLRLAPETSLVSSTNRNVSMNESNTKTIQGEVERISKSSRDFGFEPLRTEKGKTIPKMNKSVARLLQTISFKNSRTERSNVISNDELPERKDLTDDVWADIEKSSKSTSSVRKESSRETKRREESIPRKSRSIESHEISESGSKSGAAKTTTRRYKEKQSSLLSNIKSMFKSSNKSDPQQRSTTSSEDPENGNVIRESLHSSRTDSLGTSVSEIEADREQSIHFTRESVEIPMIQSMKSLQDNRKRSKNRRRTGHRLLDGEDTPFVTENLVTKSNEAATQSDFIRGKIEDGTREVGIDSKSQGSQESVAESNLQNSLTEAEEAEDQNTIVSSWRKKFKKKDNFEGNTKRFALSVSRIFSNSSRKKKFVKESRTTAISQMNSEDHFEIAEVPPSSSANSSTKGSEFKVAKQKPPDVAEDNGEEIVAIESLDAMDDSGNQIASRKSIENRSLIILEPECDTDTPNDRLLCPGQSGTFIYSAPVVESRFSSENDLEKKDSSNNDEDMEKPAEKIYATKGTIVSYAPMVESAKYMPDKLDNQSNEDDDQLEDRQKGSCGKSFAAIRKLFSRASIRSRQDRSVEDHSVCQADQETEQQSEKLGTSSKKKQCQDDDHFVGQSNEELRRESVISAKTSPDKIMEGARDGIKDPKLCNKIKKQLSKSKVSDVECPVVHDEVLLVNNVGINSQSESSKIQSHKSSLEFPSNHIKKSSLLSMAKSYIKEHTRIERQDMAAAKQRVDEKTHDEHSLTLPIEDSKKISKQRSITKTESVLSRSLKKIFKKRRSVVDPAASTNNVEDPADDLNQSNVETLSHTSTNESTDFMSRNPESKGTPDDVKFAVYNSKSKFLTEWDRRFSQRLKDKNVRDRLDNLETSESESTVSSLLNSANESVETLTKAESQHNKSSSIKYKSIDKDTQIELPAALAISGTHTAVSFPAQINPESEIRVSQEENVAQNQSRSKMGSKDFRLNASFASRRSTVVMMATPIPPRKESEAEVSTNSNRTRDESSNSPTAFYYLLGPTLDEALVDVRVVFQNLIDKITGRSR